MDTSNIIDATGKALEARVVAALGGTLAEEFADLAVLRTLKGERTGYTRVWHGDRLHKISSMSIDIKPGMARYLNLQVTPADNLRAPRFVFEGLVMGHASQLSVDLYPDMDMVTNLEWLSARYADVAAYYDSLRKDETFTFNISKFLHMRVFCSPVFLLSSGLQLDTVPAFENIAGHYFDHWLKMFAQAEECDAAETAARSARRKLISEMTIALDPDRKMVTGVYGEEYTQRIEAAAMY